MLMQKSTASFIRGWDDLAQVGDAHPVVVENGSTMNFLKVCNQINIVGNAVFIAFHFFAVYFQHSTEAVFERIWYKCEFSSSCLVSSNEEGVRRAR